METLQITLMISLIILCLTFIGTLIYVIIILKETKETLEDARDIIKTVRKVSSSVVMPLTTVMGVVGGLTRGLKAIRSISNIFEEEEEDDYEDDW